MPQPRHPVFRRQRLRRPACPRPQSLRRARAEHPAALPAGAHRHRPQLPRSHRLPRPNRPGIRRAAHRRQRGRLHRQRHGGAAARNRLPQRRPGRHPARNHRRARLRRTDGRRAARRRKSPRQRAHLLLPRRIRPMEPQRPAPRTLVTLQHPPAPRRKSARVPHIQLDRT